MALFGSQWMANAGADAYSVGNSVLLNDDDSEFLGRTPSSDSNRKKGIISCWVKRANLSDGQVWGAFRSSGGNNFLGLGFSSDAIAVQAQNASSTVLALTTSAVFRDPHAWYHIVFVYDTTPSTPGSSDIKIFVNGEVAALSGSPTYPSQNVEFEWGNNANGDNNFNFTIGDRGDDNFFDGYIAEFAYQDGQSFSAITDYGETDSNGVWRPKDVSGLTFGTNGYYLPFSSSTNSDYGWGVGLDLKGGGSAPSPNYATSGTWSGGTSSFTWSGSNGNNIESDASNVAIKSNFTFTGDFDLFWNSAYTTGEQVIGVYEISEDGTFSASDAEAGMDSMTNSWYWHAANTNQLQYGGSNVQAVSNGNIYWRMSRRSGVISVLRDKVLQHTYSQTSTNEVRVAMGAASSTSNCSNVTYYTGHSGNDFVSVNSPTQSGDSPTKNFCVLTPLEVGNGTATFSEGNLKVVQSGGGNLNTFGSIGLSSGKWHFEVTLTNTVDQFGLGIIPVGNIRDGNTNQFFNNGIGAMVSGSSDGNVYNNGSHVATITGGSGTDGQTLSCEIDLDNDQLEWFNNAGSSLGTYSFTQATANSGRYLPCVHCNDDATYVANFGASTFSKTPSTNFTGISAALLKEQVTPAIEDGTAHQQTVTYSGDNGTRTVAQSGNSTFTADWVWIKDRDFGNSHALWDRVRGSNNFLKSDSNAAQATEANVKTSGDGFSDSSGLNFTGAGASFDINASGRTYVAWQWKGDGTSGETNDDGSIDSTVNVHDTAGFVIGKYTTPAATAAVRTVGHGLGGALDMLFIKNQASGHWVVWHNGIGDKYLRLNSPDKAEAGGTMWNSVLPSANATTFTIGTNSDVNGNDVTFTFYGFRAIAGYSAFGSYEGNGNSDGPVISLGFKPAFTLIKNMDVSADSWIIQDNAREPNNAVGKYLQPNLTATEGDSAAMSLDYLSNGFKVRGTEHNINESGQTHVYMAFAEYPFAGTTPAPAR